MYSQVNRSKQIFIRETVLGALCSSHSGELDLRPNESALRISITDFVLHRRFPSIVPANAKLFFAGDELLEFALESASVTTLEELSELTQTVLSGEFPDVSVSHDASGRMIIDTGAQTADGVPRALVPPLRLHAGRDRP
eukprot:2434780-Pleurochrysis_carterae.AAC.1